MRSNRAQPVSPIMKPRRTARPAAPATPGAARQRVPRNPVALGLATRVCDDPYQAALEAAREMTLKNPHALRAAKRLLTVADQQDQAAILLAESVEQAKLIGSSNQAEAVRANLEKRAPRFADPQ